MAVFISRQQRHAGLRWRSRRPSWSALFRVLPPRRIECFQCLVGKVGNMTDLNITVNGSGGKKQICHLAMISAGSNGRDSNDFIKAS
jgi:hypothetical protein